MPQKPPVWSRINREHALTRGLVGCWLFNEGGGAFAHDAVGGAYNRADLINGPAWVPGTDGRCLSFDGVDDYVKTTRNDFDLCANTGSPLTFVALINPALSGAAARQGIVNIGEFNDLNFSSVFMILSATGELIWSIDPAGTTASSGLLAAANKWQNVAMVRNASEVRFFLESNKAVVANASANGVGSDPIIIGGAARNGALGSFYFAGKIGFVMVYNRALSDGEVQQLFADPYALFQKEEDFGKAPAAGATQTINGVGIASTAADGVGSLRLKTGAVGTASTAADGVGSDRLKVAAVGVASTAADGVGTARLKISAVGVASTAATGVGTLSQGRSLIGVGRGSTAADGVGALRLGMTGSGRATTAATGAGSARLGCGAVGRSSTAVIGVAGMKLRMVAIGVASIAGDGVGRLSFGLIIDPPFRTQTLAEPFGRAGSRAELLTDGARKAVLIE
jgi:hypothetical protein